MLVFIFIRDHDNLAVISVSILISVAFENYHSTKLLMLKFKIILFGIDNRSLVVLSLLLLTRMTIKYYIPDWQKGLVLQWV